MQNNREPSGLDNIVVRPVYLRAVNAIVHPEIQAPCSLYFLQNWLPRLGSLRWSLVLALRTICTQRQPDGTSRGEFTRGDLARVLGVHEATISRILNTAPSTIHPGWRVLQPVTNDDQETNWLAKFIPRLRYKYERDPVAAVTRRIGYIVDVVIDDPLIEDDEEHLAVFLAEQLLQSAPGASTVTPSDAPPHIGRARPAPDTAGSPSPEPGRRRAQNTARRNVKTQSTSDTDTVNAQNASLTSAVDERFAPSHGGVNQHKASHVGAPVHDVPTLTLTNNYKFRDITIDLRLKRKRDIRIAVAPLASLAGDALNDDHSKGMFFSALAQLYPSHLDVFTDALKIAEQEGQISGDVNMGAVFVNAIKQLAADAGAELKFGRQAGKAVSQVEPDYDLDGDDASFDEGQADQAEEDIVEAVDPSVGDAPASPVSNGTVPQLERAHSASGSGVAAKQLWPSVLLELAGRTSKTNYEMWLRNCEIMGFDGGVAVIGTPSAFARDWIEQRLLGTIQAALRQVVGKEVTVRCEVMQRAAASVGRARSKGG